MNGYVEFLLEMGYSASSIRQHVRFVEVFQSWLSAKSIKVEQCKYPEMIDFIDDAMEYFATRMNPKSTLNRLLISISTYYDYLISGNSALSNPAKNIRIKNPVQRMVHNLLKKDELDSLYHSIESNNVRNVRNKVILGFLVFQGLTTGELHRLTLSDIRLRKGIMVIGETSGGCWKKGLSARKLDLEALQIIDLIDYIENYRPRILGERYRSLPGRKPHPTIINPNSDQVYLVFQVLLI